MIWGEVDPQLRVKALVLGAVAVVSLGSLLLGLAAALG